MNAFELEIRYGRTRNCFEADLFSFDYFTGLRVSETDPISLPENSWCGVKSVKQEGPLFDFLWNSYGIPVVSERVIQALSQLGARDQNRCFPISVKDYSGKVVAEYFVLHLLTECDAICFEKSDLIMSERRNEKSGKLNVGFANSLVLKGAQFGQAPLFRLHRYSLPMFCNGEFERVFRAAKLTGVRLKQITVE